MKGKIQQLFWLGGVLLFGFAAYSVISQSATTSPGTLEAKLQANADGTVSVLFRGVPGQAYQIGFTDGDPQDANAWQVVAQDVMAGNDWTTWVDTNATAMTGQWFYQVVPQLAATSAQASLSAVTAVTLTNTGSLLPSGWWPARPTSSRCYRWRATSGCGCRKQRTEDDWWGR